MPSFIWPLDPMQAIVAFEQNFKAPQASALLMAAVSTVDSLYYLADLDAHDDLSQDTMCGHRPDVLDVAHSRWATGGCITALDLCAAGLGRAFCNHTAVRELSVPDMTTKKQAAKLTAKLPPVAKQWVIDIDADPDYQTVKLLRDTLVHARVKRHYTIPRQRLQIEAGSSRLAVPDVINLARETATRHAFALVQLLPSLRQDPPIT